MSSPTALALRVNNLIFVSASTDFLVSKSVGFPHAFKEMQLPSSNIGHFFLSPGTRKIKNDCFKNKPYIPGFIVRQPIFKSAAASNPELYDNEFVVNNSYDLDSGVGKIFLQKYQKTIILERNDQTNFRMEAAKSIYGKVRIVRPILELQIEMLQNRLRRTHYISEDEKRQQLELANTIIGYTREQIRLYNY
jgi:hypothetical protein